MQVRSKGAPNGEERLAKFCQPAKQSEHPLYKGTDNKGGIQQFVSSQNAVMASVPAQKVMLARLQRPSHTPAQTTSVSAACGIRCGSS